jgi:hypothetical protein
LGLLAERTQSIAVNCGKFSQSVWALGVAWDSYSRGSILSAQYVIDEQFFTQW